MQRPKAPTAARSTYAGTTSSTTLSGSHCSIPARPIRAPYDFRGSSSQPVHPAGWTSSRPHFDGGGSSSQPVHTAGWTSSRPHFDGGGFMQSPHRPSSSSTYTPTRPTTASSTQWPSIMPGIYFLNTGTYQFICSLHISINDIVKPQPPLMGNRGGLQDGTGDGYVRGFQRR